MIVYGYDNSLAKAKLLDSFSKDKNEITIVKNYCDNSIKVYQMIKYFALVSKDNEEIPADFSNEFYTLFDEFYKDYKFMKYYHAFQNYLTKKPYSREKIKLNFEKPQLLTGFDQNKESGKGGVILRKDNIYYLAIINKKFNKVFDEDINSEAYKVTINDPFYEKMVYKLFPNAVRMIPKICFAKENKKVWIN